MINQVTLVGRLTRDPELRVTPDGTYVANIILAVNRNYRNQNGEIDTDFVQCTLWKKSPRTRHNIAGKVQCSESQAESKRETTKIKKVKKFL